MTKKQRKIIRAVLEFSVFCLLLSACAAKTVLDDLDRFAGSDTGAYGQAGMTAAQQAAATRKSRPWKTSTFTLRAICTR